MSKLYFSWDPAKAKANIKKHGISFEEAQTIFYDENAELIADPEHSKDEDRFVMLGMSMNYRVLVVCHCYRSSDSEIRIISARKATKHEQSFYGGIL